MNVTTEEFQVAIKPLLSPDPDSNSPAEEGRRLIPSENGRGYRVVNYSCYRDMKSDEEKREYMREYMRKRREEEKQKTANVKSVNLCKTPLNDVTHTEADTDTKEEIPSASGQLPHSIVEIFQLWDSVTKPKRKTAVTRKRITAAKTRLKELEFREGWRDALKSIPLCPFLTGNNEREWKADIDWFLKPDSVVKILEGKYSNGVKTIPASTPLLPGYNPNK